MNKKLLLSFALAAAMAGCINDADVPSGNGDNPISGAKGGNNLVCIFPDINDCSVRLYCRC